MKKYGIIHVELPVSDAAEASKFYRSLFDWQFRTNPEQSYGLLDTGEISAALNPVSDELNQPGHPLIYVASQNVEADLARAAKLGAEVIVPRTPIPGVGWLGIFADPAGNQIGLLQLVGG